MSLEFAYFWILIALVIGYWNKKRGNSFFVGALYSLLLSPVIGIIVVLMSSTFKCPYCKEAIKQNAVVCKHCGSKLVTSIQVGEFLK